MTHNPYTYDASIDAGTGRHMVPFISGVVAFFATLALAAHLTLAAVMHSWLTDLSGTITVEIPPTQDRTAPPRSAARDIVVALKGADGVTDVRILGSAEVRALLQPWLGETFTLDEADLPTLIDIRTDGASDTADLSKRVKNIDATASLDTHGAALNNIARLGAAARTFILTLIVAVFLLSALALAGIVRTKLRLHWHEIETLHLIGAHDADIVRPFRRNALKGAVLGAGIGTLSGLAFAVTLAVLARGLGVMTLETMLPKSVATGALLFLLPVIAAGLVAHIAAGRAALRELARLP